MQELALDKAGIIGHRHALEHLAAAHSRGRLPHALLFAGPDHVGKTAVARALAASLLGADRPDRHPDFFLLERERDKKTGKLHGAIVLEQVQALVGRLSLGAMMNGWKVCVLDGAHLLNKESANALLKTLEEPHEKTLLILLAASAERVMPTIRSRTQIVRFNRVPTAEIVSALAARGVEPAKADLYARLAGGRPGLALDFAGGPAALEGMFAMRELLLGFPEAGVADRWAAVEKLIPPKLSFQDSADRARAALDLAAELLRDALLIAAGKGDRAVHVDVRRRLDGWAERLGPGRTADALEALQETRRLIDENVNPRAAFEHFALSF